MRLSDPDPGRSVTGYASGDETHRESEPARA